MTEGKTKPKPLHTEATLLAAMETAGKEIEGDELRQSLKECGILFLLEMENWWKVLDRYL